MDDREGAVSERAVALSAKIGQNISDLVTFPLDMSEGDFPVVLEPVTYLINTSSQTPTVSHFMRIGPPKKLIGDMDKDLRVSFNDDREEIVLEHESQALPEAFKLSRVVGVPTN